MVTETPTDVHGAFYAESTTAANMRPTDQAINFDGFQRVLAALAKPPTVSEVVADGMGAIERVEAQCALAETMGGTDQMTMAMVSDLRAVLSLARLTSSSARASSRWRNIAPPCW